MPMQREQVSALERLGIARTQTGYYYIAHYPPLRAMEASTADGARVLCSEVVNPKFEIYAHFPFCEVRCSFCHFYKELVRSDFTNREELVVRLISKEILYYKQQFGRIEGRSLYIGGGTPSLMSQRPLSDLLRVLHNNIHFEDGAEKKFEFYPKEYSLAELREKLALLREFGFTDIVVDLESGNQASLRVAGRQHSSMAHYRTLVDECQRAGFTSVVTALIIGLPYETKATLRQTLGELVQIPCVRVINTFPLIIRRPDPVHRQLRLFPQLFPTAVERDKLWMYARDYLREEGFHEGPTSYFSRYGKRPRQQADKFECVNLLGFGPSAFGYWNFNDSAIQYFNWCNLPDYQARIERDESAIWRVGRLDNAERARRKLIFGLANCKVERLDLLERRFNVSVDELFGRVLNGLLNAGLIELNHEKQGIRYTEAGLARVEEISYYLGSETVNRGARSPLPVKDRDAVMRHNYYIRVPRIHRLRFKRFVATQSDSFMHNFVVAREENRSNPQSGFVAV